MPRIISMLGVLFEGLDHPPAPEGVGSGDENAVLHAARLQPNHTLRRTRSMS